MTFQVRETDQGFLLFTPAGNVVDTGDTLRPRYFKTQTAAEAWGEWANAARNLTKSQRRELRRSLGARIGLTYDQARGFFA